MINSLIERTYDVLVREFLVKRKGNIINLSICDRCVVEGHLLTIQEKSERMDDVYIRLGKQVCLLFFFATELCTLFACTKHFEKTVRTKFQVVLMLTTIRCNSWQ
jgi:hypothetical protein